VKDQIVAPKSYLTFRATKDLLTFSTRRGHSNPYYVAFHNVNSVFFDESVYSES
jgi:hypothetical protein